jgi:DNA polymerase-3 subunit gamma/tau
LEKITIEDEAVHIMARAADGSVRDGLSLFDQAIAQSGGAPITADMLRAMMGRADMSGMADLFGAMMAGDAPAMLGRLEKLHQSGSDPAAILDDLLEFAHFVTRIKIVPHIADQPELPAGIRADAKKYADQFALSALSRVWQMLLKAVAEVAHAPSPQQALEMALIRVAFAAPLPPLEELLKNGPAPQTQNTPAPSGMAAPTQSGFVSSSPRTTATMAVAQKMPEPVAPPTTQTLAIADFAALVKLAEERDPMLGADLYANVREVKFQQGKIEIVINRGAARDLVTQVQKKLLEWTGVRWVIVVATQGGQPTLAERDATAKQARITAAYDDAAVKAFRSGLSGATIINFKTE